jgi:hypothetical protein
VFEPPSQTIATETATGLVLAVPGPVESSESALQVSVTAGPPVGPGARAGHHATAVLVRGSKHTCGSDSESQPESESQCQCHGHTLNLKLSGTTLPVAPGPPLLLLP